MSETTEVSAQESQVAAQTEGHVVQTGGSSPLSFDELESLDVAEKVQTKIEAKKEKEKEQLKNEKAPKDEKPAPKKQAKEQKEPKNEQPKESAKDSGEGEQKEAQPKESEEGQEAAEKSQKVRTYKVQSGDNKVAVRGDTKFQVKVDGEMQEVDLQDALNSWSGHKAVDKRMGEFGAEKQKFIEERRVIDDTIGEMAKAINEGTPEKAIMRFFEALGSDPIKGMQDLRKSFLKGVDIEKLAQTEPEERDSVIEESSTQDIRNWYEQQKIQRQTEAETNKLNSQIEDVKSKYQINDAEFNKVALELLDLKEAGKIRQETIITPEIIGEAAAYDRKVGKAKAFLEKIGPELVKNREAVEKVTSLINAQLTDEEITQFVAAKFGVTEPQPQQDSLSRKFEKQSGETTKVDNKKPQNEDMWNFDHI